MPTHPTYASAVLAIVLAMAMSGASVFASGPALGEMMRDCAECPELVVVPAGIFVMGSDSRHEYERPPHTVTIAKPFAIGAYEVTFDEWGACVAAGGCDEVPDDHGWGQGRRPIINVTFAAVGTYLAWLSRHTGKAYRLPTDAEWEYAARGGTTAAFWWGDDVGENRANCRDCGSEWSAKGSGPVGSFDPNPYGLYDTAGNVWEWVADCWFKDHVGAPADGSARIGDECRYRVMRGGSWYYFSKNSRSAWRFRNDARVKSYGIGFRVLRELE